MAADEPRQLVVISGVTSGIGRALYRAFSQRADFCLAGCGRRRQQLIDLQAECGGDVAVVDVSSDDAVCGWASQVIAVLGRPPAIVIANAGILPEASKCLPWATPPAVFQEMLDVNVLGVANMARHWLPPMVAIERGAFIAISSGSGRSTGARKGAYSASKFAVEAYVKCIAHALPPGMVAEPLYTVYS